MKDNKIIQIIQEYRLILIGIIFSLICIFPTITNAVSVPINYTNSWTYYRYHARGGCGGPANFYAYTDFGMTLNKQFDLTASGVKILAQNESTIIPTGVNLIATNYNVTGSYEYSSADKATPPMDDQIYNWDYISSPGVCHGGHYVRNQMRGGISSQVGYTLISSDNNIIDCSAGTSCITKNNGTATVTVNFPGSGSYYVERRYSFGDELYREQAQEYRSYTESVEAYGDRYNVTTEYIACLETGDTLPIYTSCVDGGCDRQQIGWCPMVPTNSYNHSITGAWGYSLSPISYTMTVRKPNQAPTVNYTNTTLIEYNTATSNWSYSDPEGDVQTYAQVQVATDTGFNNIVFSNGQAGAATNMPINGLAPSATYYPRVKVWNNENGEGKWVNGPAFSTKVNNPPNLDQLSCGGTGTGYITGNINWNYTGTDEPGDELILKARWRREGEVDWVWSDLPYNTRTGNIDINNLISGYTYDIQVSLNDNRNSHLGDRWKGCGTLTPQNYPAPKVTYSISKTGDSSKSETNGETLVLNTGDNVNATWSITDTVGLESCALSTTGGANLTGEQAFRESLSLTDAGFSGNIYNKQVPTIPEDRTYSVNLNCTGKLAKTVRSVNQTINLKVESYPIVSCSIENDKRSVQEGDTDITIKATVGNVNSYTWKIGRGINDTNPINSNGATSNLNLTQNLSYVGLDFGRYSPWIEVTKSGGDNRTTGKKSCGTITNFGSRTIREVNP